MSSAPGGSDVLADPVFQLNLALWLLRPAPKGASWTPLLADLGWGLDSIARTLPLPLALRPAVQKALNSRSTPTSAAPEVLASSRNSAEYLAIECKGGSFGPESTNARQAGVLLAVSRDLTDALGLAGGPHPGTVVYLTVRGDHDRVAETLEELRRRLASERVDSAPSTALGISRDDDGVRIEASSSGSARGPLTDGLGQPVLVLRVGPEDDPRPLYFIPWDPSVEQTPALRVHSKNVLFGRVGAEAVAVVGRVDVPGRVALRVDDLLDAATAGLFQYWRARGEIGEVSKETRRFLWSALEPYRNQVNPRLADRELEFELPTEDVRADVIEALLRQEPPKPLADEAPGQTKAFEDL